MRYLPSGKAICNFRVDGTKCAAWEELGEKIYSNILPGDKVKVFGTTKERWWTTSDGEKQHAEEFIVNRIQVLERPKSIVGCCYYCTFFNTDCMSQCNTATGGLTCIEACRVVEGRCAELDHSKCWTARKQ